MKTAIKNKWITALTSGEYEQCHGALGYYGENGDPDTFCCLGVLSDVMLDDDKAPISLDDRINRVLDADGSVMSEYDRSSIIFNHEGSVLPKELAEYLGIDTNPSYRFYVDGGDESLYDFTTGGYPAPFDERGNRVELDLADLNDTGLTFVQIADVIRWAEPDE